VYLILLTSQAKTGSTVKKLLK